MSFLRVFAVVIVQLVATLGLPGLSHAVATTPAASMYKQDSRLIWHFVLRNVSPERARWMVDHAMANGYGTIQIVLTDGVILENAPWTPSGNAWPKNVFIEWVRYAENAGMSVVPELHLLSHQEKLFQDNYPSLMFNKRTYDPRNEQVYKIVFKLIDEVVDIVRPKAFHIGHDELAGFLFVTKLGLIRPAWVNKGESPLPADLFSYDVNKIHNYLKSKNIETWMWGDMLINRDEFPNMVSGLHGTIPGYGRKIRSGLPKDIVVCDWHYKEPGESFPSMSALQNEGFRVIGTVFEEEKTVENFIKYALSRKAYGVMVTSWYYVQRKEWDKVQMIMEKGGRCYNSKCK